MTDFAHLELLAGPFLAAIADVGLAFDLAGLPPLLHETQKPGSRHLAEARRRIEFGLKAKDLNRSTGRITAAIYGEPAARHEIREIADLIYSAIPLSFGQRKAVVIDATVATIAGSEVTSELLAVAVLKLVATSPKATSPGHVLAAIIDERKLMHIVENKAVAAWARHYEAMRVVADLAPEDDLLARTAWARINLDDELPDHLAAPVRATRWVGSS